MIVKSFGLKTLSFSRAIEYVSQAKKTSTELPPEQIFDHLTDSSQMKAPPILWNLQAHSFNATAIKQEFINNSRYLKYRKRGNFLYHEIISLSDKDKDKVTPAMLNDLAQHYLELRAGNALALAVSHYDTNNPHIHLILSANYRKSPKRMRLSKKQFQQIKLDLEAYQRQRYPELTASQVNHAGRDANKIKYNRGERELIRRREKSGKRTLTVKEQVRETVGQCFIKANSVAECQRNLSQAGFQFYRRGEKTVGVRRYEDKRKYRLSTLGLMPLYQARVQEWSLNREREIPPIRGK